METISDKLAYLLETRNQIRNAIEGKGIAVLDSDTFRSYADKIRSINTYPPYLHTTIYIDQSISDPSGMATMIYDDGGLEFIRLHSHRYTCKLVDGILRAKQLQDMDGTLYLDGSVADLTGADGDIMMKLPIFYYKAWSDGLNKWYIDFAYGAAPSADYKKWEGDEFIGVYEGYIDNNQLHSISGVIALSTLSQSITKQCARNRGVGFTLTTWKQHSIMAFLFLAQYLNSNSQGVCGLGLTSNVPVTGDSNLLGMTDTIYNDGESTRSVNFWGLERWWGGRYEWLDNVITGDYAQWLVDENDTLRSISVCSESGMTSMLSIGEHLDAAPIEATATSETGYCDRFYYTDNVDTKIVRSGLLRNIYSGVFYIASRRDDEDDINLECTGRLAYKGSYEIIG